MTGVGRRGDVRVDAAAHGAGDAPAHSATHPPSSVTVVSVTYADRAELAARMVEAVAREGVGRVVLVLNGVAPRSLAIAQTLARSGGNLVELVQLDSNEGSASGFARGLAAAAAHPDAEFVWLLDDDNVPRPGALDALLAREADLGADRGRVALLAFRTGLDYMAGALRRGAALYPPPSCFLGFDIRRIPRRLVRRRTASTGTPPTAAVLPYAPYGGLLLPRLLLERIGLPDPLFVVYSDDSDFTARVPAVGGRILLVGESLVDDIAASGLGAERDASRIPKWSWYAIESEQRAYYAARNQIAFEHSRAESRAVFLLNGAIVTAWMVVLGVASRRTARMRVILRALADGVRGRLGPRRPLPSR